MMSLTRRKWLNDFDLSFGQNPAELGINSNSNMVQGKTLGRKTRLIHPSQGCKMDCDNCEIAIAKKTQFRK